MLIYLFLLAATTVETSLIDLIPDESEIAKEVVTILNKDENLPSLAEKTSKIIAAPKAETITITNAIEPNMLEYKHWTGKYSPEQFSISINGTEVSPGTTCEISAPAKTIEIEYTYSFMNGMKTGGRKISYELNENISQANITFDWKNDWRVMIDNGKAVKEISS